MMEVLGVPSEEFIMSSKKRLKYFDHKKRPYVYPNSNGERRVPGSKTIRDLLKCDNEPFVRFISSCLRWEPRDRITAEECGRHPFIKSDDLKNNDSSMSRSPHKTAARAR